MYNFHEYLIISMIHAIYLLGLYFITSKISKSKYKKSFVYTVFLGTILGLALDFIAVLFFKFWEYPIESPLLYIFVILGWYIPAVPLCLVSMKVYLEKLTKTEKSKVFKTPFYIVEFIISTLIATTLGLWRISVNETTAPMWFFPVMLILAIFLSDSLLGLVKKSGLVTLTLRKNYLATLAPFVVGVVVGIFAESLNIKLPLYNIINTPESEFLEIPTFALVGWGIANLGYWTIHELLTSQLFSRFQSNIKA